MPLFELTVRIEAAERPSALELVPALDKATAGKTSDVVISTIDDGVNGGDVVSVVMVPAYMAICRHCEWKFRYALKREAIRFAGMHREQRHGKDD